MRRTIKCRLAPTPVMAAALSQTAERFSAACNAVLGYSTRLRTFNKVKLQHAAYREIRDKFGLTANLAIRAIARVSYAVRIAHRRHRDVRAFRAKSIDYDARIFDYRKTDETVSVSTVKGRIHVPLALGRYQRDVLRGHKPTCARVVRNADRTWDIHIAVEETEPPKRGGPPLGIDLGIKNVAAFSTGKRISGAKIQALKSRFRRVRASLQSKRTRGANSVLRRLSGRERRFISCSNHRFAKDAARLALSSGCGVIRMEDLRGIRSRTKTWNRHLNRMISGWSFGELQRFIRYKAERAGLMVETVNPAWTSQTCASCRLPGVREGERFSCTTCGESHADVNAARLIAAGGVEPREIRGDRNATRIADRIVEFSHSRYAKAAGL